MPAKFLEELYDHTNVVEIEALSELIDEVVVKIIEEFRSFEAVRACFRFYSHRPVAGKNPPIYRDCLEHIYEIAEHARNSENVELYFQNAGARIRQYRDMLDPDKNLSDEYRLFLSASNKPLAQVQKDIEETLSQYLHTLVSFDQMQKKAKKDEIKQDLASFLGKTGYTLESLHFEINPTYKTAMDKVIFKHSGWELKAVPVKVKK